MVVICDELVRSIKHVLRGIAVDEDTLALDVIREAGHGGSFLAADHTVRHFRKELYFPSLFQRKTIEQWVADGAVTAYESAHYRVEEILAAAGPLPLPPEVDRALEQALNRALAETSRSPSG
jgi:trimethylamine--corrinoid protein Co-methyltransferase